MVTADKGQQSGSGGVFPMAKCYFRDLICCCCSEWLPKISDDG